MGISRNDILTITGLIMLGYGLYLAWPPLALIIPGALFLFAGIYGAGREGGPAD